MWLQNVTLNLTFQGNGAIEGRCNTPGGFNSVQKNTVLKFLFNIDLVGVINRYNLRNYLSYQHYMVLNAVIYKS